MHRNKRIALLLAGLLLLTACGEAEPAPAGQEPVPAEQTQTLETVEDNATPTCPYIAPTMATASFNESGAKGNAKCKIDLSGTANGYVAVSAKSDKRLKFQVVKGQTTYNYDIRSDGTPSIFPLQSGDGSYKFRVMENIHDSKYAELYATSASVKLSDQFAPFLRPSDYCKYNSSSLSVQKSAELAKNAGTALGLVTAVYDEICRTVRYDDYKASTVKSGYLPDPDETMRTGKGICFDYASLAAAMLRSQGVPCKLIFGYVSPNDLYHAWNMFWTAETGWVTVSYQVTGSQWNRLDLTFSANGADATFIGDGTNYAELYQY